MEGNSWRPAQGDPTSATSAGAGAGGADPSTVDWRAQLQHEARQRIVNKIMETLKRHLPISVPEGLNELQKIAVRFEEKIYTAATCQADYLKKISLKMLSMESKTHPTPAINAGQPQNPGDPVLSIPPQVSSQSQSLAIPLINQSSARQALLPQNIQNNTSAAVPTASSNLSSGLSTLTGVGQPSTLQNMSGMSQNNASHSVGQVAPTDIYANTQRQIQGRQQILSQQQQQSQNQLIYQQQQQLQQQFLKQKYPNSSLMQPHIQQQQQQQQSLLQPNTLQSSQQSMMQMSSGLQQTQPTAMQQNQLNSIQQPVSSLRQQQQVQSTMHQQTSLQQQSAQIPQQPNIPLQTNISNSQQNQLIGGQQNSASDMQQPQQRLPVQQNSLLSMQQNQQILNQQTISLHQQQQQLVPQNNMSGLQQQQQQQQQQQMPGTVPNMQAHQRQMSILQQSKAVPQQQPQGQLQSAQQQVMSQFQSQPGQLQQQFGMQQQQNSLPREMQQRIQASAALLQPQNAADQQKLFMQSQRPLQEVSSSTSVESTAQTGPAGGVDWQEEIYQKIISMKELYFADLSELSQRIVMKLQQHDTLMPPGKLSEQYEKMKSFKGMLDRTLAILKLNKGNIQSGLKDKLPLYEKQIVSILASHKKKPPQPQGPQQQFQHSHSMPQQQPSQVPPMPKLENQMNQLQQVNMQPTANTMQQAGGASGLQHVSMPMSANFGVPNTQQNMTNSLQAVSNLDSIQSSSLSQLQQGPIGSLQHNSVGSMQNPINASQQVNSNALPHGTMNSLQSNLNSSQPNSSTLQQQQQLKQQQQEQQRLQQMKQLQQRQMQQLLQQQQQQQQQQLPLQQQQQLPLQQQLHQQQKQQQVAQMSMHQIPQMNHQATEVNEVKMRQGPGMKPGLYPQNFSGSQRAGFYHQQLKPAAPFPISSPQNLQASSPQISHHSSPQIDQHNLLSSQIKAGTPLQSTNSPFVPSPSTPIAPSPVPSETEKQVPNVSSLPSGGQIGSQQANLPAPAQSLAVGTPGISASPLLAEFARPDGNQANLPTLAPYKAGTTESPLDRLLKVVQSASPQALSSAVSDIGSVVSMIDRIAGSAPGNGSRAAVGEDLVAMTKCRLQARNFMSQDGNSTNKKMKRDTNAMPLNNVSSAGSVNDSFMQLYGLDASELQSTATSRVKKHKAEVNHALVEEIREINQQLIDTVVNISEEDADSLAASSEGGDGTVIICSYTAVALCPSLKSQFASAQISPILPLRLLVPANYPKCSPVLLDKLPDEQRESDDLSTKAKTKFNISLRGLSQPMSLKEIAKTWDSCARKAIAEYAQQAGGGSFSSRFGAWENCVGA